MPHTLTGFSYIAGQWHQGSDTRFYGFSPAQNEPLNQAYYDITLDLVDAACSAAQQAFVAYRQTSMQARSEFLHAIADEIDALGEQLLDTTHQETNLPMARLQGEKGRTMNQLRAFADALAHDLAPLNLHCEDAADPARQPLPKPHTQLKHLPVGPVAVFGASNFPYAFSTLGGDTAAALAAGCPVVMKSHRAHPGTSELMTQAIDKAIMRCNMPAGVFSMLQGVNYDIAHRLVAAQQIKAVGFTGSMGVAKALMTTIQSREEVIPFYGELGSINPQVVLPNALQSKPQLAQQLCASMLMGNGQFCTSPGLWLIPHDGADEFLHQVQQSISAAPSDTLLTPGILRSFVQAIDSLTQCTATNLVAKGEKSRDFHANAHVFSCDAQQFLDTPLLHEEVFGPSALIVRYRDMTQLLSIINALEGQLTASIHGFNEQSDIDQSVFEVLSYKVGRLIKEQMPTGVEVCQSMNHGGPFPSSTDVRSTSVGIEAMRRFMRPLCVQS
ncbi:aldehyde dehydrogenase (NADP(+)) [Pseudoalteromonas pernae]|uniref:aldehyde dehydrogenase (NADP(+)) n=1 Tax=Pseudoalteromonas pernae TaxID=3118054 RepID=UPI00324289E1